MTIASRCRGISSSASLTFIPDGIRISSSSGTELGIVSQLHFEVCWRRHKFTTYRFSTGVAWKLTRGPTPHTTPAWCVIDPLDTRTLLSPPLWLREQLNAKPMDDFFGKSKFVFRSSDQRETRALPSLMTTIYYSTVLGGHVSGSAAAPQPLCPTISSMRYCEAIDGSPFTPYRDISDSMPLPVVRPDFLMSLLQGFVGGRIHATSLRGSASELLI